MEDIKSVILAWWNWTRLWPISRESSPKQFAILKELDWMSLFQITLKRALKISKIDDIYVVVSKENFFHVWVQSKKIWYEIKEKNIIIQPSMKETLPVMCLITKKIWKWNIITMPSDHLIRDNQKFKDYIYSSLDYIKKWIISFWIVPTKPETWYWYIEKDKKTNNIKQFHEKPDKKTALKFIKKGFLWNSWIYLFNSDIFWKEVSIHKNEMKNIFMSSKSDEEIYNEVEAIPFETWIAEKSKNMYCISMDLKWSDLGSFDSIWEYIDENKIKNENIIEEWESKNNIVLQESDEKEIALIDVEDLVIVDTSDVLLISKRWSTQKVKQVVKKTKKISWDIEYRPWWSFRVLSKWNWYKTKKITVLPWKKLSLQSHQHRSEHWVVVEWTWVVTIWEKDFILPKWESIFVPIWKKHRIENKWKIPLIIIESQIWDYLYEDDIERFDDDFWRQ